MNHKADFSNTTDWKKKAAIITLYHIEFDSTIRATALFFSVSIGYVSEALKLIDHYDTIKHCEFRKDALERIK